MPWRLYFLGAVADRTIRATRGRDDKEDVGKRAQNKRHQVIYQQQIIYAKVPDRPLLQALDPSRLMPNVIRILFQTGRVTIHLG
jgi:hypothetical protein